MTKNYAAVLVWLTLGLACVLLLLTRGRVESELLTYGSLIVTVVWLCYGIIEKYAWKWPLVGSLLSAPPDISGTWKGELLSDWTAVTDGESNARIPSFCAIRQTFYWVHVKLLTKESCSWLLAAGFIRQPDGQYVLLGVYRNEPAIDLREKSPIHFGGVALRVLRDSPLVLQGEYWTDRSTKGCLRFTERCRKVYDSFEQAQSGEYGASP